MRPLAPLPLLAFLAPLQAEAPRVDRTSEGYAIPAAPAVPAEVDVGLAARVDALVGAFEADRLTPELVREVARHRDPRVGWVLVDLLSHWDQQGVDVLARMRELTKPLSLY